MLVISTAGAPRTAVVIQSMMGFSRRPKCAGIGRLGAQRPRAILGEDGSDPAGDYRRMFELTGAAWVGSTRYPRLGQSPVGPRRRGGLADRRAASAAVR